MLTRRSILGSVLGTFALAGTPKVLIATLVTKTDMASRALRIRRMHGLRASQLLKFRNVICLTDGTLLEGTFATNVDFFQSMTSHKGKFYSTPKFSWKMADLKCVTPFDARGSLLIDDQGFVIADGNFYQQQFVQNGDTLKVTQSLEGAWEAVDPTIECDQYHEMIVKRQTV